MKPCAYVLVSTHPKNTEETYRRLCDIPGVKYAHATAGRWDAVLFVEGKGYDELPKLVIEKIRNLEGIQNTETLFAFKGF